MASRKVHGFVRGRDVLVWDAEDAVWLRREWRVVGSLVGALPLHPRQNSQLGIPLVLLPEETTLMREEGILGLWEYVSPALSERDCQLFQKLRTQDVQEQWSVYQLQKEKKRDEHQIQTQGQKGEDMDEDAARKRAKLDDCQLEASDGHRGEGSEVVPSGTHGSKSSFSPHICIHTVDPRTKHCPQCFRPARWLFPNNTAESLRYRVFCDLWRKGYYLTNGLKYGGDYLVYPGDPALVHSHYVAIVLPWQQSILSLVSMGRLGSKVKKNMLLCSEDGHGSLCYFTLQWSGLS